MKGLFAFCAGAFAGFLVGSTKQGMAWRNDLDGHVNSLFGNCLNGGEESAEKSENEAKAKSEQPKQEKPSKSLKKSSKPESTNDEAFEEKDDAPMPISNEPLDLEKAKELAEKLGAKVSEPEGEEALPFSHPIETSTSRLTA